MTNPAISAVISAARKIPHSCDCSAMLSEDPCDCDTGPLLDAVAAYDEAAFNASTAALLAAAKDARNWLLVMADAAGRLKLRERERFKQIERAIEGAQT